MHNSLRQALIAATAIIGMTSFAIAAPPPGTGNPIAPHASSAAPKMAAVDQQISDLHAKLRITPAQQAPWDQFALVMRDNAKNMDEIFHTRAMAMPSMTAADNMKSYAGVSEQHAQDMQKLVPAFQALYGTMSDGQKKMADQVFRDGAAQSKAAKNS